MFFYGMRRLVYHNTILSTVEERSCRQFTSLLPTFSISEVNGSWESSERKIFGASPLALASRLKKNPEAAACNAVDLHCWYYNQSMSAATNSNESYCTFTLASDVTAGGLPSEEEIAKQLESNDPKVCLIFL